MRKFTTKQSIYVDKLLDEAWDDGYKAAEFDVKHRAEFEKVFNAEEVINSLFTAEANMKRAEAEFNKREQPIEQRVQDQLGHPLFKGKVPEEWKAQSDGALEAKREQAFLVYGSPDELYTFWGVRDDH